MESNRDEADKCLEIAMRAIREGNRDKAGKFVKKAEKLFPSRKIQEVLNLVNQMDAQSGPQSKVPPKQRNGHREASSGGGDHDNEEATTSNANYTQEQVEAVKRIRKCKNYYEMLSVSKDSSESELKKSYRKLALAFHPDKNSAPGASEAFKAIGNAYAVLSDSEKKRQYDLYGDEEPVRSTRSHRHGFYEYDDPSHGFQADMTAEEIFNMFFGGGMPGSNVYVRRGGRWQRQAAQGQQAEGHGGHQGRGGGHHHYETSSNFSAIFQLMPILLLILVSMLSSLLVSDPIYNLDPTHKYNIQRRTTNLKISYYVKDSFSADFTGSLKKLEREVEDVHVQRLRDTCFRERAYKENLLWQARYSGNSNLMNKAHNYPTNSCNNLEKLYNRGG